MDKNKNKWIIGRRNNPGEDPPLYRAALGVLATFGLNRSTLEQMIHQRGWIQGELSPTQLSKLGSAVRDLLTHK